ncbi:PIN domain-containing protein [Candidatus Fermentibacteria bacterium]|nr:PIN domain-containing protein [Candidatus Fermentibacteria bacterium]
MNVPGVGTELKVLLDTSALFAAVWSDTGGARQILRLGEARAISLWVGPRVLEEAEAVLDRKSPGSKRYFALLLDRSEVRLGGQSDAASVDLARSVIGYVPDAAVVAEALTLKADYLVSFDREHLVGNPRAGELPFPIGTAGDFLAWYRERLASSG